jgi:hypothetical protein
MRDMQPIVKTLLDRPEHFHITFGEASQLAFAMENAIPDDISVSIPNKDLSYMMDLGVDVSDIHTSFTRNGDFIHCFRPYEGSHRALYHTYLLKNFAIIASKAAPKSKTAFVRLPKLTPENKVAFRIHSAMSYIEHRTNAHVTSEFYSTLFGPQYKKEDITQLKTLVHSIAYNDRVNKPSLSQAMHDLEYPEHGRHERWMAAIHMHIMNFFDGKVEKSILKEQAPRQTRMPEIK